MLRGDFAQVMAVLATGARLARGMRHSSRNIDGLPLVSGIVNVRHRSSKCSFMGNLARVDESGTIIAAFA